MQVHRSIDTLPTFTNAVITIGTFDGVHAGHKIICKALVEEARKVNGESVIITFDPHPRKVVKPDQSLQLLNTIEEKIELLDSAGIQHLVIVPFTKAFSDLSANDYIQKFLIDKFHPHTIIIGYDHHFGKGREGNYALLEAQKSIYHYNLIEISKHVLHEIAVSSTKIRNALLNSDVETANKLLGYHFFFEGKVIEGDKLGRKLGYPTANLVLNDHEKVHLGQGVYAVYVQVGSEHKKGMLSIGNRPTITGSDERIEVNIFDFDREIYGEVIRVIVKQFLRPQEKYPSLDALVEQLHRDKEDSLSIL